MLAEMLRSYGWMQSRCIPHGGHQMSLNIAARLGGNASYPDPLRRYEGFPADECLARKARA